MDKQLELYPLQLSYVGQSYVHGMENLHGLRSSYPLIRSLLESSSKLWFTTDTSVNQGERLQRRVNLTSEYLKYGERKASSSIVNRTEFQKFRSSIESKGPKNPPTHGQLLTLHFKAANLWSDEKMVDVIYHKLSGWAHGLPAVIHKFNPDEADFLHFHSLAMFLHACSEMFKIHNFGVSQELKQITSQVVIHPDDTGYNPWGS